GLADPGPLPVTVKILLEGLLRDAEAGRVKEKSVASLASWPAPTEPGAELPFTPSRVLLQDFTGVPAVVDLAAMRSAVQRAGKDPSLIDPLVPADLVIDHFVLAHAFGTNLAFNRNIEKEYERNSERYALLRCAQQAFRNILMITPGMGICDEI